MSQRSVSGALVKAADIASLSHKLAHYHPQTEGKICWRDGQHGPLIRTEVWDRYGWNTAIFAPQPFHTSHRGTPYYREDTISIGGIRWDFQHGGWAHALNLGHGNFTILSNYPRYRDTPKMIEVFGLLDRHIPEPLIAHALQEMLTQNTMHFGDQNEPRKLAEDGLQSSWFQTGQMFGDLPPELITKALEIWCEQHYYPQAATA